MEEKFSSDAQITNDETSAELSTEVTLSIYRGRKGMVLRHFHDNDVNAMCRNVDTAWLC
jgi:hypothetical protein